MCNRKGRQIDRDPASIKLVFSLFFLHIFHYSLWLTAPFGSIRYCVALFLLLVKMGTTQNQEQTCNFISHNYIYFASFYFKNTTTLQPD